MADTPTHEALRQCRDALDYTDRRLQADIDDGSRPDQWSMEDIVRKARAALAAADAALSVQAEPDMRHPKIQALIGSNARRSIELSLVEQLIDNPDCDLTAMDMEYWNGMHDRLRDALLKAATPQPPAPVPAVPLTEAQIDGLNGLDTSSRVRFYEHDFYVLSNFSAFSVQWGGYRYPTSEHLYHVEKFRNYRGDIAELIATAPSAHEAFKIAERHKSDRRPDWDEIKVTVMGEILRAKVAQHEYVRRKLLATGDRELVEDSWRDDFWGWGPNRDGQNMLGKLWMQVRSELLAHNITGAPDHG